MQLLGLRTNIDASSRLLYYASCSWIIPHFKENFAIITSKQLTDIYFRVWSNSLLGCLNAFPSFLFSLNTADSFILFTSFPPFFKFRPKIIQCHVTRSVEPSPQTQQRLPGRVISAILVSQLDMRPD